MNKAYFIGRLTKDPELKSTQSGLSVCSFSIGVNRRFDKKKSDFFNIIAWRALGENCAKYLVKGQQVAICGEIQTRSYEDKNGVKRYVTEIVADDVEFLARPKDAEAAPRSAANMTAEDKAFADELGGELLEDEELPF